MSGMSGTGIDVGRGPRRAGKSRIMAALSNAGAALAAGAAALASTLTTTTSGSEEVTRTKNTQRDLRRTRTGQVVEVNKRTGGRPAESYHANGGGTKLDARTLPHVLDRATYRSYWRARDRRSMGRWPGIGDPNATVSYRKQLAAEATAQKPKRSSRKGLGAMAAAMALGSGLPRP